MIKKVKEPIGFQYLLSEMQLHTLILLEFWILIPKEVLKKTKHKSITRNIFRMQDNDFIMCEFYFFAFVEYMLARKALLIILIYFL